MITTVEETGSTDQTDMTEALQLSYALTGDSEEAARHVAWLMVVARRLVVAEWHRIEALAIVLLERIVLSGEEAAFIIAAAKPRPA